MVDWNLILTYRALLQANVDLHMLGETTTSVFAYSVLLWGTPVLITLDADVDCRVYLKSEWLRANVLVDQIQPGQKCYIDGHRPLMRMCDMPTLML